MKIAALLCCLVCSCRLGSLANDGASVDNGIIGQPGIALAPELIPVPAQAATPTRQASPPPSGPGGGVGGGGMAQGTTPIVPDDTFDTAPTRVFVREPALSKILRVDTVLKSLAQTRYAEVENVGTGPYKAIVARTVDQDGLSVKEQQSWIVDSKLLVDADGSTVNRVQIVADGRSLQIINFDIYQSPLQNADGSYSHYGEWRGSTLGNPEGDFTAQASLGSNGESIIAIVLDPKTPVESKVILHRSQAQGFGKLSLPERVCNRTGQCSDIVNVVRYAYDTNQLAIAKNNDPVLFKDRGQAATIVLRYGLFDQATKADVNTTKTFGFPFTAGDIRGFYGQGNGKHLVWSEAPLANGAIVTRDARRPGETTQTYKTGPAFDGVLEKRKSVAASLAEIKGVPFESEVITNTTLLFTGGAWNTCATLDPAAMPPTCTGASPASLEAYTFDPASAEPPTGPVRPKRTHLRLVAPPAATIEAVYKEGALYPIEAEVPVLVVGPTPLSPQQNALLVVDTVEQVFVAHDGTGFVKKKAIGSDPYSPSPLFDDALDTPYALVADTQYRAFINGNDYTLSSAAGQNATVSREVRTVATPRNSTNFVAANTVFLQDSQNQGLSTFRFQGMSLVYDTVGQVDAGTPGAMPGAVVKNTFVRLIARVAGVATGERYDWRYPQGPQGSERQSYLLNADGTLLYLDEPLTFAPLPVKNAAGANITLTLQFDGQLQGLPVFTQYAVDEKSRLTSDAAQRVVNLSAGTELRDQADANKVYVLKPLDVAQVLRVSSTPSALNVTQADDLDLANVPAHREPSFGNGPPPRIDAPRYIEGKRVQ